jgi:pSer/pThr/pTyr-binding forkhead associated (FHA) protein
MAKLHFVHPNFAGITYSLVAEKTTVGRNEGNTLVIQHDSVSAHHCEILVHGAEVIVRDLGSRNGTLVDGIRLQNQQSAVKSGHTIRFGSVEARLEIEPASTDAGTDMTAIVSHSRAMRVQRRAARNPLPDPAATLNPVNPGGGAASELPDSTVALSPSPAPRPSMPATTPEPQLRTPNAPRERSRPFPLASVILTVIGIAVLLLVLFLWLN